MLVVNIPIEPIEERYSADWGRWFEQELQDRKLKYKTIMPQVLTTTIREGAFLDVVGTTCFKARQIASIAFDVNQGTIPRNERVVFLIQDGWFPVEQLAYMRDMLGCHDWKFVGIFHAGTYDRWDQTAQHGMYTWGEDVENAWFKIYDKVVVASRYHANLLLETRNIQKHKIEVIPWKVEVPDLVVMEHIAGGIPHKADKKNIIVFPHRRDPEKQFDEWLKVEVPNGWTKEFTAMYQSKNQYYSILAKSKIAVSFSLQETFGIAMVEAVLLGCIPLVPDRLSYKEMYPECFRYSGVVQFKAKLEEFCSYSDNWLKCKSFIDLQDKFKQHSDNFFFALFDVVEGV